MDWLVENIDAVFAALKAVVVIIIQYCTSLV
jgi:hypothetical protein